MDSQASSENQDRSYWERLSKFQEKIADTGADKTFQDYMRDLQSIDFQNTNEKLSDKLSSLFRNMGIVQFSTEEQDQIYFLISPVLKNLEQPVAELFCYLYIHQANHSPDVQRELVSYFKPYCSHGWLQTKDAFFISRMVQIFKNLLIQLYQNNRIEECQQIYQIVLSLQDSDQLRILSKPEKSDVISLYWGESETIFSTLAKTPFFVKDIDSFKKNVHEYLDYLVKEVCHLPDSPTHMAKVLERRFFFKHPFVDTMDRLERISNLLVQIDDSDLLGARVVTTLLDTLLTLPWIESRFSIVTSVQKYLAALQLSEWSVQTHADLESRIKRLYAEAETQR